MKQSSPQSQAIALHRIDIASPCTASWDKMKGDNRVRHCSDCNKNVFNLSAMREAEAAALLAGNEKGELCVRFYQRKDGTVMTSDCSTSPRAYVRRTWRKLPAMASMAFMAASVAACTSHPVTMGEVPPAAMSANDSAATIEKTAVTVAPDNVPEHAVIMMGAPPAQTSTPEPEPVQVPVKMGKIQAAPQSLPEK